MVTSRRRAPRGRFLSPRRAASYDRPVRRRIVRLALASSLLFVSGAPAISAAQESPRPASGYEGVVPGSGNPPPAAGRLGPRRRGRRQVSAILTWPGFQMMPDGGSRFFVQTTGPARVDMRVTAERVEVVFHDTSIHLRNSARWLETAFFETPVTRARLERRGRDIVLVMRLRAAVTPRLSSGSGVSGDPYQYTYLDFAPGRYRPEEPEAPTSPGGSVGMVSGGGTAPPPAEGGAPPPPPRRAPVDDERPPGMGPRPKR